MTVQQPILPSTGHPELAESPGSMMTSTAAKALAVLRITVGLYFLWAFLDKMFGWQYHTPPANAWIHGGSPTKGFLNGVAVGPFQSQFHAIAGAPWADWLFMIGLLCIGIAVIAGVAIRIATVSAVVMLAGMWLAEWPLSHLDNTGAATGSTNPFIDDHVVDALVLIVVALTYAGTTWGLGRIWARIPFVARHRWAL
jgi:thiosulfate dehydrogenase [quinone] large subunit